MTPAIVISQTEQICGLAPRTLRGRERRRRIAEARGIAAYLARELTGAAYQEIGEELGRDKGWAWRLVEGVEFRLGFGDRRLERTMGEVRQALGAAPGGVSGA